MAARRARRSGPARPSGNGRAGVAFVVMVLLGSLAFYAGWRQAGGPMPGWPAAEVRPAPSRDAGLATEEPRPPEPPPEAEPAPAASREPGPSAVQSSPRPEALPPAPARPTPVSVASRPSARVAVVIDDMGHRLERERGFLESDRALTLAVLPHLRDSRLVAGEAARRGKCLILHLPMEASGPIDPGPGTLRTTMGDDELARTVRGDFDSVPGIAGFNNHEGSRGTEDPRLVEAALDEARARGLFVLDSRTTPRTVLGPTAERLGLPTVSRQVFLDNDDDVDRILVQIDELGRRALREGSAVAIGHPRPRTLEALERGLPRLEEQGIAVVPLADLVSR